MKILTRFAAMAVFAMLAGCQSVGDVLSLQKAPLTVTEQAALAVDMNYQQALRTITASGKAKDEPLAAAPQLAEDGSVVAAAPTHNSSFGHEISRFFMGDDYVVHRHATRQAVSVPAPEADPVNGEVLAAAPPLAPLTRIALTYFLVTPQGVVEDYATGSLDVATTSCIDFSAPVPADCGDSNRLSRDLDLFDAAVRTSKGLPLSSWSPTPAGQAVPLAE